MDLFGEGPRVQYEKRIGDGASGQAFRFKETREDGTQRRFAVKMPIGAARNLDILKEIYWLTILRNCSHIVQLIAVVSNDGTTRQSVTDSRLGPYVIMEYLQNGTLMSFLEDIQGSEPLPHAFILSVFLCMVRACLDMAYNRGSIPQQQDAGASTLAHRDMYPGNFVFGDFDPRGTEHHIFPILKLIDFGRSGLGGDRDDPDLNDIYRDEDYRKENDDYTDRWRFKDIHPKRTNRNDGIEHNIRSIGAMMVRVISRDPDPLTLTEARRRITQDFVGWLDPEIRTLVARCLAPLPEYRPTLEELSNILAARLAVIPWPQPVGAGASPLHNLAQIFLSNK